MPSLPRKAISKAVRFDILERDGFACIYCGARAPEAILHIDHVMPFSLGGEDEVWNYATACGSCNIGKLDRIPDEDLVREIHDRQSVYWRSKGRRGLQCRYCRKPLDDNYDEDDPGDPATYDCCECNALICDAHDEVIRFYKGRSERLNQH